MPKKCLLCGKRNNLRCFPRNPKRSRQWLINIGKEEILNDPKQTDDIVRKFKLCNDHFADWCFTSTEKKRLIVYAEPCKPNVSDPGDVAATLATSSDSVSSVTTTSRMDPLTIIPKIESQTSSPSKSKCTLLKIIPKAQKVRVLKITDKEFKRCLFDKKFLKQLQKMLTPNQYQVVLSHVIKSEDIMRAAVHAAISKR